MRNPVGQIVSAESVRRAARTFVMAFATIAVPGLLGWLHTLTAWATAQGGTAFPDAHGLAYLGVSAVVAGCIAVVNLVWNTVEDQTGKAMLRPVSRIKPTARTTPTRK